MKIFRKNTEKNKCCESNYSSKVMREAEIKKDEKGIKVLGSGCKKCMELEKNIRLAIQELELVIDVEHISDFATIASYGVMSTPAFVLNGKVVSYGEVLTTDEIKKILVENKY